MKTKTIAMYGGLAALGIGGYLVLKHVQAASAGTGGLLLVDGSSQTDYVTSTSTLIFQVSRVTPLATVQIVFTANPYPIPNMFVAATGLADSNGVIEIPLNYTLTGQIPGVFYVAAYDLASGLYSNWVPVVVA